MKHRDLDKGDVLPQSFLDSLQEYISTLASQIRLSMPSSTTVRINAGNGSDQAAIGIDGLWRYRTVQIDASASGAAGPRQMWVTATANVFTGADAPADDTTDYAFGFQITSAEPTGSGIVAARLIGELWWDGTKITEIVQFVGVQDARAPLSPTSPQTWVVPLKVNSASAGQGANLIEAWNLPGGEEVPVFSVSPTGAVTLQSTLYTEASIHVGAIEVAGEPLASHHLADAGSVSYDKIPVGHMMPSARPTEPAGWLKCDGRAVSRTTFAALWDVLRTDDGGSLTNSSPFGNGDGSTTFNLPDLRGRLPVGPDDMGSITAGTGRGTANGPAGRITATEQPKTRGLSGGAAKHALSPLQTAIRNHYHRVQGSTGSTAPSHNHGLFDQILQYISGGGWFGSGGGPHGATPSTADTDSAAPSHSHSIDINSGNPADGELTGSAHENMPPYQIFHWYVKF